MGCASHVVYNATTQEQANGCQFHTESIPLLTSESESARRNGVAQSQAAQSRTAQARQERLRWRLQLRGEGTSLDDQSVECYGCSRPYPRRELAGVDGLPGYRWPRYCPACVEELRAAYARVCVLCGASYWAVAPGDGAGLCHACDTPTNARELARVRSHLGRARELGLPATLTFVAWLETLAHFAGCCAYCAAAPFTDLDHFVPLSAGGGTTADNCVPSCARCNSLKGASVPCDAGAGSLSAEAIARVAAYLRR
jgi:5-methylcytosine-specific restriction endonuclease McrA